jgi:hypothetical protein
MTDSPLFTEPVLVVNQKAKLIEINNEYAVFDQAGTQIGAVREVGQSKARKVLRVLTSVDQFLTHRLEVVDTAGTIQLVLVRPAKLVKSKVQVQSGDGRDVGSIVQQNAIGKIRFDLLDGTGQTQGTIAAENWRAWNFSITDAQGSEVAGHEIGAIVQKNAIGKIRFDLEAQGQVVGSLNAENWRAWNFNVQDPNGTELARITKTWEGLAKTMFTTADNYMVQIHRPLEEPLRSLVVAAALAIDTALKQDSRGLG